MTDVLWEGLPNWISATTGILTLGAAVTAAIFAGHAARWTKEQAQVAARQATTAEDALELTRADAADARGRLKAAADDARRSERRQAEARLDPIAPVVLATARRTGLEIHRADRNGFEVMSHDAVIADDALASFRTKAQITLRNVSSRIARVDFTDPANGELSVRQGTPIILAPGETKTLSWSRTIGSDSLRTEEDIGRPEHWWMTVELWVRDLGMNVRDTFRFGGDFRHFKRDGSRLLVAVEPAALWTENVAEPTQPRIYERLDAGLDGISPAGRKDP